MSGRIYGIIGMIVGAIGTLVAAVTLAGISDRDVHMALLIASPIVFGCGLIALAIAQKK